MQPIFKLYYKKFGLRRAQNLLYPKLFTFTDFPRDSFFHYISTDELNPDLDVSKLYFSQYSKRILVDYPDTLTELKGRPAHKSTLIKTLIRSFHIKNKQYKYMKDHYLFNKDSMTLLVNNYSYLSQVYRYVEMPLTSYYKWWNTHRTIYDTINNICDKTERNNFIFINMPKEIPGYSFLNIYSDKINNALIKIFDSPDKLMILEIWKWLSLEYREQSVFSNISPNNFSKINLVFITADNKSSLINLSYLNSWIKGNDNKTEIDSITQFSSKQIQLLFLKFLLNINSTNIDKDEAEIVTNDSDSNNTDLDIVEEKDIEDETTDYYNEHDDEETNDTEVDETIYNDNLIKSDANKKSNSLDTDKDNKNNVSDVSYFNNLDTDKMLASLDEEIKNLDSIDKRILLNKGIKIDKNGEEITVNDSDIDLEKTSIDDIKNIVYKNKTYSESILSQVSEYAEYGVLTASEYKKILQDIDKFSKMKDPYGSNQIISEKIIVTKEDIQISSETSAIEDNKYVVDKSMLNSSLLSFDKDYIDKVLQKDIISACASLQNAGVVVKRHDVEIDHSALGSYEYHTLELKPIDGATSTIHFKIPKVNDDGTFIANGNKYIMRKQRADKKSPITR